MDRDLALSCIASAGEANLLSRKCAAALGRARCLAISTPTAHDRASGPAHQHKGQLFYYLKLMGKDVSTGDLWGA